MQTAVRHPIDPNVLKPWENASFKAIHKKTIFSIYLETPLVSKEVEEAIVDQGDEPNERTIEANALQLWENHC